VVTAVTVQDTVGVDDFLPLMPSGLPTRHAACWRTCRWRPSRSHDRSVEAVAAIAEVVSDYPTSPGARPGAQFRARRSTRQRGVDGALIDLLLPQTTVLTPNSIEARRLAEDLAEEDEYGDEEGTDADSEAVPELAACARRLIDLGCEFVLITVPTSRVRRW